MHVYEVSLYYIKRFLPSSRILLTLFPYVLSALLQVLSPVLCPCYWQRAFNSSVLFWINVLSCRSPFTTGICLSHFRISEDGQMFIWSIFSRITQGFYINYSGTEWVNHRIKKKEGDRSSIGYNSIQLQREKRLIGRFNKFYTVNFTNFK